MENEIKIGDVFIVGVGIYNMDTKKNDEYVEAEVIKLSAYDDDRYCTLEMIEYGGPDIRCLKSGLKEKDRVR